LQPVAGVDAGRPHSGIGGLRRARYTGRLPLWQGLLQRACFPGVAAYPCDSGFGFGPKSIGEPRTGRLGLDFAGCDRGGCFNFFFLTFDREPHSALRAELRPAHLTCFFPRP